MDEIVSVTGKTTDIEQLIGSWLGGRSESSRRAYAAGIARAARVLGREVKAIDWSQIEPAAVEHIREQLIAAGRTPATVNLTLAAIRSLIRHAWRAGLVSHEQRARLEDVAGARGSRLSKGRHVEREELAAMARACRDDGSVVALRDVALIGLAATAGLRRAELAALRLEDLEGDSGRLVVRGKGNKERAVYVTNGALDALRDWIGARGAAPGPLFVRLVRRQGGEHGVTTGELSTQSVADILKRRAKEAGLDTIKPHDLRRTVAGELLDNGTDIATVARMLGHASVTTTQRYDRRPEAAVAVAAGKIRFPYRRSAA
jgi:site-specific recombinase XerD